MKYLLILSLVVISFFAFSPGQNTPAFIVNHDKAAHALTFFVLTFLLHRSFSIMPVYRIIVFSILIGIAIELIQLLFTSRGFSFEDLMYDVVGVSVYSMIYVFMQLLQRDNQKL